MPLPRQSSNSSRMRSSTGKGRAAGPALKLCTRFTPRPATVVELTISFPLSSFNKSRIAEFSQAPDPAAKLEFYWRSEVALLAMRRKGRIPDSLQFRFDGRKLWRNDFVFACIFPNPERSACLCLTITDAYRVHL